MKAIKLLAIVLFLIQLSCSDGIISECPEETGSAVRANFSSIQSEVFSKNCATSGCHSGLLPAAGLNLSAGSAYNNIVDKQAPFGGFIYIKPGSPDESYLYLKISSTSPGTVMPPTGRLPQSTIDSVRVWIEKGANND